MPAFFCPLYLWYFPRFSLLYSTSTACFCPIQPFHCRHGISHDYDIVIGAMTNDQIYNYIADYMDSILTRGQFWSPARFKYPTHQIIFCSLEALKCLTFRSLPFFYQR
ncbi:MAG: DUF3990 domain-containing protein [Lachnospiraceae bacterium]|nr:DUF3990 domain-containing protein [Lachnospiraceae bacterium]